MLDHAIEARWEDGGQLTLEASGGKPTTILAINFGRDGEPRSCVTQQFWRVGSAGSTSYNAETLDGLDSTKFFRSDTSDTMSGSYTITSNLPGQGNSYSGKNGGGESWHYFYDDNSNQWRSFGWDDSSNCFVAEENDGGHHRVARGLHGLQYGYDEFSEGHTLPAAFGFRPDRRATGTLYLYGGDNDQYVDNTHSGPKGAALTGSYRSNGLLSSSYATYTRVA